MVRRSVSRLQRPLRFLTRLARDRRGMSAVEFGVAAPIFLAVLSPVIDLGFAFSQKIQLNQAAETGAQYASLNAWSSNTATNIQSAVNNAAAATTLSLTWTTTPNEFCGCPNAGNTAIVSHDTLSTCGTANGGTNCSDGSAPGYYVTFTVQSSYTPVMPYTILANPTTLVAQPVVRVQ